LADLLRSSSGDREGKVPWLAAAYKGRVPPEAAPTAWRGGMGPKPSVWRGRAEVGAGAACGANPAPSPTGNCFWPENPLYPEPTIPMAWTV